jgi:hypothetical protein
VGVAALAVGLATGSACSGPSGSKEAFCEEVSQVPALESVLARFSEADPEVLQDRIDRARAAYEELADAAPGAIRDDADAVVGLVDEILAAVEDHASDPAAAADQLRDVMDEHEGVDRARQQVATYAQDECGVRLDPTLGPSTDDEATTTTAPEGTSPAGTDEVTTTTVG